MAFANLAVVLVAKFPAAGKVKTRLMPELTPQQAAAVHRCFVLHMASRIRRLEPAEFVVYFDPPDAQDAMKNMLSAAAPDTLVPQCAGDLGRRLAHIARVVTQRHERLILLGADSPDVPHDHLVRAVKLTAQAQVSISPAEDGGYWSIGLCRGVDFERLLHDGIEWSADTTADQTLTNAQKLRYATSRGETWDDVDRPEDLRRLLERLAASDDADDQKLRVALEAAIVS